MGTEGRGEASQRSTQCQSKHKEGHMTNIYLSDSGQEAIVDFAKDHEELYIKTNEKFKDKTRKDVPVGEICKQLQALSESVQDVVRIPKDAQ